MTENIRPLIPTSMDGLDEVANALLNSVPPSPPSGDSPPSPANIANPEKYLFLPARSHGTYTYPDTLISLERSHNGKNWFDTHKALAAEGAYMPTIRQFVDFLKILKSGRAFDGRGKLMDNKLIEATLDDITKLGPYRGRWLDADFKVVGGKLHMNYGHTIEGGNLVCKKPELLQPCLMSDKTPGISLDDWITNANAQGLPLDNVKNGDLYYRAPMSDNNSVAWFGADSAWARLSCGGIPSDASAALGVNAARKKNLGETK